MTASTKNCLPAVCAKASPRVFAGRFFLFFVSDMFCDSYNMTAFGRQRKVNTTNIGLFMRTNNKSSLGKISISSTID